MMIEGWIAVYIFLQVCTLGAVLLMFSDYEADDWLVLVFSFFPLFNVVLLAMLLSNINCRGPIRRFSWKKLRKS